MTKRDDKFKVGDKVWWNVPVVMQACRTWVPDTMKPTVVIAVRDHMPNAGHSQLVRVSPNYCPYGDEFDGSWFYPINREKDCAIDHNGREIYAKDYAP